MEKIDCKNNNKVLLFFNLLFHFSKKLHNQTYWKYIELIL